MICDVEAGFGKCDGEHFLSSFHSLLDATCKLDSAEIVDSSRSRNLDKVDVMQLQLVLLLLSVLTCSKTV